MSGADTSPHFGPSTLRVGSAWAAAESAFEAGDLATARDHAASIAAQSTGRGLERRFGRAHHLLARVAEAGGDTVGAERSFRAALSAFTLLEDQHTAAHVLSELASLRLRAGDFGGATEYARQALGRAPGDVRSLTVLGYAQWLGGSPADGESSFEQALRVSRNAVPALAGRGQIRADLGEYRAALADLDRALALGVSPQDEPDVRSARALALAALGRASEADAEMARALSPDPARPRTRLRRALIHTLSGQVDQASHDLEEILTIDPAPIEATTARRLLARLRRR